MKHTIMAALVAGTLLLAVGNAALATEEAGGGSRTHSARIAREAGGASDGIFRFGELAGGRGGATGEFRYGVIAVGSPGGVTADLAHYETFAGGPDDEVGNDVVVAGGARGGIVDEGVIAGGALGGVTYDVLGR
jgi:hypothetical protein